MRSIFGRRVVYTLFALLLIANMATLVILWRDHAGGHRGGHPQGMLRNRLVRELDFDAVQTARYDSLVELHRRLADSLRGTIGRSKRENLDALRDSAVTDSVLEAGAARTSSLVQRLELATTMHFREVRALCRPEQKPRFDALMQDVALRMGPEGRPPAGSGMRR